MTIDDGEMRERMARYEADMAYLRADMSLIRETVNLLSEAMGKVSAAQDRHEDSMNALDKVMGAGLVLRWIVIFVVGSIAAVGTVATSWEAIQKWLIKP